jgi:Zn finger protein HypA/HybF involved in hydrogenase expression
MSHGGKGSNARPFSVSQEEFANSFDRIFGKKTKVQDPIATNLVAEYKCWCYNCLNEINDVNGLPVTVYTFIVCPDCGNKRCPKSTNHNLACTDSNEPGQAGSRY